MTRCFVKKCRDPEIDEVSTTAAVDEQIGRLLVSVDDAASMCVAQCVRELQRESQAIEHAWSVTDAVLIDVLAVDVLERKIRCVLTARVNAQEPARSKTLTIWSRHCINYPSGIN